jgi:hypothetical protein
VSAPSREVPIDPAHAALLIIDVKNYRVRAEVACDLGYLVTLVTDACTTTSADRHEQSLIGIRGYCRQRTTDAVVAEITALTGSRLPDAPLLASGKAIQRISLARITVDGRVKSGQGDLWLCMATTDSSQPDSRGTSPAKTKLVGRFRPLFDAKGSPDNPAASGGAGEETRRD